MITTAEEQTQVDYTETIAQKTDKDKIIPWTQIVPRIEGTEEELKRQLQSANLPFLWAENGEWGIPEAEAVLIIEAHFRAKAVKEIEKMRLFEVTESKFDYSSNTATVENVPLTNSCSQPDNKRKTSRPAIKLVGEYKPVKNLQETAKRFLEAIAPGNPELQDEALEEIIAQEARGKKYLKLAIKGYELPEVAPSELELAAAFLRIRDRRIKDKPTGHSEQQSEEVAQN